MIRRVKNLKSPRQKATLLFLIKKDQILLAMKKRGFGKGRFNGVGGKPEQKEKIEAAAIRETKEEISCTPKEIIKVGVLDFYFPHNPAFDQQVIVYTCRKWSGTPRETEEMKPKWFEINNLPYKKMWSDDALWLPHVMAGKKVKAKFIFNQKEGIEDYLIEVI